MPMDCIFCKIASREIPKDFLYEDTDLMVFLDIYPSKPTHLLIVPKKHMTDFMELQDDTVFGKVRQVLQKMIKTYELDTNGFRIVVNGGGAQKIDHLHFHLTGPWVKA